MDDDKAIVTVSNSGSFLAPAAALETILQAYQVKKEFINKVLVEGVDYGATPGTSDKPSLKKPGAEKMATLYALVPVFEDVEIIEDWNGQDHGGEPFFYYREKCKLYRGDRMAGSADGSCNSWEKKYRYRSSERICPNCGKATIIKGKSEYGGGWICFSKKGGCGAKFKAGDKSIEGQEIGQVKNPDVAELVNTVLKMAQKRALVAAVLIATNASDYFTQDLDDFVNGDVTDITFTNTVASTNGHTPATPPEPEPISMAKTAAELGATVTPVHDVEWAKSQVTKNGSSYANLSIDQLTTIRKLKDVSAEHYEAAGILIDHLNQAQPKLVE